MLIITKITLITAILFGSYTFAHGGLSGRIMEKTLEIFKAPNNATLYYERGFLYFQHLEYTKATDDYLKSEKLGNTSKLLYYRTSETYYKQENYKKSLQAIQTFFTIEPYNLKALKLKAQILFQLKQYKRSFKLYNYVLNNMSDTKPEDFIEASSFSLKQNSLKYKKAIAILNKGLQKLGNNTLSLRLKKIEYLKINKQPDLVINEYNYLIIHNTRKEFWYYKKAHYLFSINQKHKATIALMQAKYALQLLSVKFKNTHSIKTLSKQINNLQNQLNYEY